MPTVTPLRTGFGFGNTELPSDFAHPPLIEVWLGAEFETSSGFGMTDATEWRRRLGPEWPAVWQSIGAAERHSPGTTRVERQLRNVMGDRAIRFGSDSFSFGWLGYDGNMYPRYETIRDGFVATLDAVRDVMPQVGMPIRWTVSYVNRIPQGTVWTTPEDWSFFRLWQPNPLLKLKIEPEGFAGRWQYPLEAERGTIAIEFCHEQSFASQSADESLWIRITADGAIDSDETSLFDGLDYGREMIVRSFNELITSNAKQFWGAAPRKRSSLQSDRGM